MDFDAGAVHRHGLKPDAYDLLSLQLLKDPVQDPVLRPTVHSGVDGVPVSKPGRQPAPLASLFGDIQDGVEHLAVRNPDVPAL